MDIELSGLALSKAQNRLEKILLEASLRKNAIEVRGYELSRIHINDWYRMFCHHAQFARLLCGC